MPAKSYTCIHGERQIHQVKNDSTVNVSERKPSTMNTKTTLIKGRDGWEAETRIELDAERALQIRTSKGGRGLQTSATVIKPTPTGFTWSPFEDFKETLRDGQGLRCTEKTVREEHAKALTDVDLLLARAAAHYTKDATEQQ
jgi:hypothetical protein